MRAGALFSGGKDSTYAAYLASKKEELECLITVFPPDEMSYMFHFPNLKWTSLQAEAMALPQVVEKTEGVKEEELRDLSRALERAKREFALEVVYTGALASVYQKTRVERLCADLGLRCISPFWQADPETHLRNMLRDGLRALVVSVSALGLDETWLGRVIDEAAIAELVSLGAKYRFHVGFEGGEGETFVVDCPLFSRRVEVVRTEKHWAGGAGYLEILEARLAARPNPTAGAASSRGPGSGS